MTVETIIILLTMLSVITSLFTEAVKKLLDSIKVTYASNVVVLIVSIVIGGLGTAVYYMSCGIGWNMLNIIFLFIMILLNWLCAMLGYDKIVQAVKQIKFK